MSLSHVLLGLLSDGPSTGYDLARTLDSELSPHWRAEISQIYPELARLRRAGYVLLRVLGPRRGPRRNLYRITAAGRRELRRWLAEAPPPPRCRDEGMVRMAFLGVLPPEERRAAILAYDRTLAEEARRLSTGEELSPVRRDVRRGAVERLEATRKWLRTVGASTRTGPPAGARTGRKR